MNKLRNFPMDVCVKNWKSEGLNERVNEEMIRWISDWMAGRYKYMTTYLMDIWDIFMV